MMCDFDAKEKNNVGFFRILSVVVFFVFTLGIASGSIYCAKCADASDEINSQINAIFDYIVNDCPRLGISVNLLTAHLAVCAVIIFAAHFKRGCIFSCAAVFREGFINGFTLSAAVAAFGAKGMICLSAIIFESIFTSAALIMLTASSAALSVTGEKNFKKLLIIFSVITISIFCIAAFARGYFSTRFIKIIYSKIL